MPQDDYRIRVADRSEVELAVAWAAAEGWNPGNHDADCYYAADPNGFLIGYLGDEPVATISAVKYPGDFGFLGFYIVRPEFRGRGYGIRTWNAAMDSLRGCTIGLDGVVGQQENYRRSGFELAFRNIRFEGRGTGDVRAEDGLVPLAAVPFDALLTYDRPFFPGERPQFLQAWVGQPGSTALAVLEAGELAGYGVLRPCRTGYKVGPLYADRPELAERLFAAFRARVPAGQPIFLDVPEVNADAVALAERHGMSRSFETARMYAGGEPPLPRDRLYGITSFEIG